MKGRFHFVRRAVKPAWLDRIVTRRFNRAGFGVFPKRGSLDAMLDKLAQGDAIVFPFDQHARPPDGIESEFLGHPAWTFRSLAIIALATGAPVLPATSWREPDGRHVLRFEDALMPVEHENTGEAIRINTRRYNAKLEELRAAPPGAVVLGAPALEDGRAGKAVTRVPAGDAARAAARSIDAGGLRTAAPATRRRR